MSATAEVEDEILPRLRDDMVVRKAPDDSRDDALWIIVDPLRHSFFRIGKTAFELLSLWQAGSRARLKAAAEQRFGRIVSDDEINVLCEFLARNELSVEPQEGGWRHFAVNARRQNAVTGEKLVRSLLFLRWPLARPQKVLDAGWPFVSWMFSRSYVIVMACLAFAGIFLVIRQFDTFAATAVSFMTPGAIVAYGMALGLIKCIHEAGHAFMARKYGVPVPTVGVALIVLMPILFTDTTAAWQLNRRQRLMIDAAGIFAELSVAVIATLAWVFLPDGDLRSIAFVTATASWVMSLFVNLNPFMRFDGYYILSDALDFENLQARGFALARWRMREFLFGFGETPPETLSFAMRRFIVLHAWMTWLYRFFLYLGIALLVYSFFIKAVGLALFVVEIVWLIGLPIIREIRAWWARRDMMRFNVNSLRSLLAAGVILAVVFIPWSWAAVAPAVLGATQATALHVQAPGQVDAVTVEDGATVKRGDVLLHLSSPDLVDALERAKRDELVLEARLRRSTSSAQERSLRGVVISEIKASRARLASLQDKLNELSVRAPHDGVYHAPLQPVARGLWVSPRTNLGMVKVEDGARITAFADSERLHRFNRDARGVFVPDAPELARLDIVLDDVIALSDHGSKLALVLDINGGPVRTVRSASQAEPRRSLHQLVLRAPMAMAPVAEMRGIVRLEAPAESLAWRIYRRIAGVLIRESGF